MPKRKKKEREREKILFTGNLMTNRKEIQKLIPIIKYKNLFLDNLFLLFTPIET